MASLIYGELIKAQLQNSATDLTPVSTGLFYFNTSFGLKWYTGSAWKTAVDLDSSQTLTFKTLDGATVLTTLDLTNNAPIRLFEENTNGSNKVIIRAPVTLAADYALVLPTAQAQVNQFLKNDGVGNLSWAPASGGAGRNYLSDWNDASRSIGTVETGLTSTGNRTSSQTSWGASATADLTIANNATVPLRETGDFLIDSSTSTSGAFVESPMFNLDLVDLSKAVVLSFDITGNAADGNYDVVVVRYNSSGTYQETISVAGNASSGTPASAKLPTGTTTFKGFFVSSNTQTDFYSVRIRKTAAVNDDFQIDSIFVGPQSLAQGAVVTDWQSYTPTFTNETGGTFSWTSGYPIAMWRRVGSVLEGSIVFNVTGVTGSGRISISYPSGLTKDDSIISLSLQRGTWSSEDFSGASAVLFQPLRLNTSNIQMLNSGSVDDNLRSEQLIAGKNYKLDFSIPVSQWTSNVTTAERAVEEYVFSTDTSNTTASSSFGYGPQGSLFPQAAVVATDIDKIVQFTTPILATDNIFLEVSGDSGLTWSKLDALSDDIDIQPYTRQTTGVNYGVYVAAISTTQARVRFGRYRRENGGAYGAAGRDWIVQTTRRWRVRKVQSGAAVGFPVSARNIVGDTSGTAVPKSLIGEKISATITADTSTTTTGTPTSEVDVAGASITLTPGVWSIFYMGTVLANGTSAAASQVFSRVRVTTSANTHVPNSSTVFAHSVGVTAAMVSYRLHSCTSTVSISAETTYKLRLQAYIDAPSGGCTFRGAAINLGFNDVNNETSFYAIRIA